MKSATTTELRRDTSSSRRSRAGRALLAHSAIVASGALLLLTASPAAAAPPHTLLGNFGSVAAGGTGSEPTFVEAAGMAVDQATGDLLAVHFIPGKAARSPLQARRHRRSFSALGTNVIDGKRTGATNECPTVPADCDETRNRGGKRRDPQQRRGSHRNPDRRCPTRRRRRHRGQHLRHRCLKSAAVDIFSSTGEYLTQFGGTYPCGVAVAPNGNVFVGNYSNEIFKFVPRARHLRQIGPRILHHPTLPGGGHRRLRLRRSIRRTR